MFKLDSIEKCIKKDPRKEQYLKFSDNLNFFKLKYEMMVATINACSLGNERTNKNKFVVTVWSFNGRKKYIFKCVKTDKVKKEFKIVEIKKIIESY